MIKITDKCIKEVTMALEDKPVRIKQCYCTKPVINPDKNQLLNYDLNNIFEPYTIVQKNKPVHFIDEKESNIFLFNEKSEDSESLDFSEFKIKENQRIFIFANIYSPVKQKLLMRLGSYCFLKLWINNTIVFNFKVTDNDGQFLIYNIDRGNNILTAEIYPLNESCRFSMRINNYIRDLKGEQGSLIKGYINYCVKNKLKIIREKELDYINKSKFEYMLMPVDYCNIPKNQKIDVLVKDINDNIIDQKIFSLYSIIGFNISKYKKLNTPIIIFEIDFKGHKYRTYIFIRKCDYLIEQTVKKYEKIKNKCLLDERDIINLEKRLDILKKQKNMPSIYTIEYINKIIDVFEKGKHFSDFIKSESKAAVYFKSYLDGSIEFYLISLTEKYTENKRYPLVFYMPVSHNSNSAYVNFWDTIMKKYEVISVSILARGVTCGSYMDEAAFFEVFNKIISNYSIDMNKIYLAGYSNGAYATWAAAQNHPHLFAGLLTVSGNPYSKNLCNLLNTNVINIFGDKDGLKSYNTNLNKIFISSSQAYYKSITMEEADHHSVDKALFSICNFEKLLTFKNIKYPKRIEFRTERIRHNKAYWIEIIEFEGNYAQFQAEIKQNKIIIDSANITALKVTIPPYLKFKDIIIQINKTSKYLFENITDEVLYFKKVKGIYVLSDVPNISQCNFGSKGMGLLDIYMDSIKIVLPEKYNLPDDKEILEKAAEEFSSPKCNGWEPQIYVNYPVINESDLSEKIIKEHNLIILDTGKSEIIKRIAEDLPINFKQHGYTYKDKSYKGKYVLMFIHPNPLYISKKVLVIYTNDSDLLNKNMFTRKFIVPTYSNGIHPYLNSEALIFDGNTYKTIYSWGDDLTTV